MQKINFFSLKNAFFFKKSDFFVIFFIIINLFFVFFSNFKLFFSGSMVDKKCKNLLTKRCGRVYEDCGYFA